MSTHATDRGSLQTAVITVVRNELDVLPAWLTHMRALCDHVYVVDHLSDDGTSDLLKAWSEADSAVRVFSFQDTVFDREKIIGTLRALALEETDADWLFTLDPDEFLPYASREGLHASLQREDVGDVALYRWRNCLPSAPGPLGMSVPLDRQVRLSGLGKVAISRAFASDPLVHIPRGAHHVVHGQRGKLPSVEVGELYHLPFRSLEQVWQKVARGTINRLRILQDNPTSGNNWHYVPLLNLMAEHPEWPTVLQLVYDYGEPDTAKRVRTELSVESLAGEFESHELRLAGQPPAGLAPLDTPDPSPTTLPVSELKTRPQHRLLLEELMNLNSGQQLELHPELRVTADGEMIHPNDFSGATFGVLEDGVAPTISLDRTIAALQASYWDIEAVPGGSAWGTHIPFLFSLITLLEPRRYVELGVQAGASFFAACQAVKRQDLETACVAVDNWIGDPHAGLTTAGEFEGVRKRIANHYGEFAGYIRADFAEALPQFEPGSIDLLHIDGFHTEEAVTHDFDSWLSRMSDRGVVIFHDINEFKADFGVWRFWRKAKQRFPHLEFGHGHGLGVLVVGEKSPLLQPIDGTEFSLLSPEANELLQVAYGGLGQVSWGYAKEIRMHRNLKADFKKFRQQAQKPARKAAKPAPEGSAGKVRELNDRVRSLRKRLKKANDRNKLARDRILELEQSTSWRLTRPVRFIGGKVRRG